MGKVALDPFSLNCGDYLNGVCEADSEIEFLDPKYHQIVEAYVDGRALEYGSFPHPSLVRLRYLAQPSANADLFIRV